MKYIVQLIFPCGIRAEPGGPDLFLYSIRDDRGKKN